MATHVPGTTSCLQTRPEGSATRTSFNEWNGDFRFDAPFLAAIRSSAFWTRSNAPGAAAPDRWSGRASGSACARRVPAVRARNSGSAASVAVRRRASAVGSARESPGRVNGRRPASSHRDRHDAELRPTAPSCARSPRIGAACGEVNPVGPRRSRIVRLFVPSARSSCTP